MYELMISRGYRNEGLAKQLQTCSHHDFSDNGILRWAAKK